MNCEKKIILLLIFGFAPFFSYHAFAHGEDKFGPNGGYVRMPGAFHTEIVPVNKNQIKLFLLDINWANPSLKNSKALVRIGKNKKPAKCKPRDGLYFMCTFPIDVDLTKKNFLWVEAERESQKGQKVKYDLPFRLESNEHDSHSK